MKPQPRDADNIFNNNIDDKFQLINANVMESNLMKNFWTDFVRRTIKMFRLRMRSVDATRIQRIFVIANI